MKKDTSAKQLIQDSFNIKAMYTPVKLLLPYLRKHWRPHAGLLALIFIDIGLTLVTAWLIGAMTEAALRQSFSDLLRMLPYAGGIILLNVASSYAGIQLELRAATRLKKDFQENLFSHMLRLPAKETDNSRTGELMTHFSQDIDGINGLIGGSLVQLIRLPLIFAAVFIYMFQIHWMLASVALAAAPFVAVCGGIFGYKMRRVSHEMYDQVSKMNAFINECIQGLAVIRSFTLEKRSYQTFYQQSEELYALEKRDARMRGIYSIFGHAAGQGIFIGCLCPGAYLVYSREITVGSMVTFLNLTGHLIYPITGLAGLWIGLQRSLPALERLRVILYKPPASADLPHYQPVPHSQKSIRFDQVSFSYDGEHPVFRSFSLSIQGGQTVAIVGHSGAGKSTLFSLLQGYYQPQEGSIWLDELRLDTLDPSEHRSAFAHVSQDTFLFTGTIRDNLMLARPSLTEQDVIEAAQAAGLHSFILSLPKGYDTEVGERGAKLSGGQKQRIAIIRAILKNAPVLLLDEATSALDSETEHEVKTALERIKAGRTTLIIAHRLSTVYHADVIIVLEQGRIVQTGTHAELAAREGAYRNLVRRQYFNEAG